MIAAIVIAKGDSNRIPKKNMKDFCGRPLCGWTIEQAVSSRLVDLVAVTTDSPEVKEYAQSLGVVVVDRPYELTLTPANQAVVHAVKHLEKWGAEIDTILAPLPTSPIRLPWDMDDLISTYLAGTHPTASAVCEQLETIIYEKHGTAMKTLIWAKNHEYYVDGGGMSCSNRDWYEELNNKIPETDLEYDKMVKEAGVPYDFGFTVLKEWQTPELDLPEHWGMAEAAMRHYILEPMGENCYKEYKHGKKG